MDVKTGRLLIPVFEIENFRFESDFKSQITDFRFQISDFRFQISDLKISNLKSQI